MPPSSFVLNYDSLIPAAHLLRVFAFIALLLLSPSTQAQPLLQTQLIISPFDPEKEKILASAPLFGYRYLPDFVLNALGEDTADVGIPVKLFYDSARSNPFLIAALKRSGKDPNLATWQDWYNTACSLPSTTLSQIRSQHPQVIHISNTSALATSTAQLPDHVKIDTNLISLLPTTELFDCSKPRTFYSTFHTTDSKYTTVSMIGSYARPSHLLESTYTSFLHGSNGEPNGEPASAYINFKSARLRLSSTPNLASTLKFKAGEVSFGDPTILNAKEARLAIPEQLAKIYDVYAVYLGATFRSLDRKNFESVTIGVAPQGESRALDLIPLRYETEPWWRAILRATAKRIPVFESSEGAASVEMSSVYQNSYQKEIAFTALKPTIIASGLQERDFSWSISGDALEIGSMRFVVILGVPRGTSKLPIDIVAQARYHETWLTQGGIVSSEPKKLHLEFR